MTFNDLRVGDLVDFKRGTSSIVLKIEPLSKFPRWVDITHLCLSGSTSRVSAGNINPGASWWLNARQVIRSGKVIWRTRENS